MSSLSQSIASTKDVAETLSYWATFFGLVAAVLGAVIVWKSAERDRASQRWYQAHQLYAQYLFEAKNYPRFFDDFWSRQDLSSADRWQYRLFISFMMWAIEDIALIETRQEWLDTLVDDLQPHVAYLSSPEFSDELEGYFFPVRQLVARVTNVSLAHA